MKISARTLLAIGVVLVTILVLGSAANATLPTTEGNVDILAEYCHCYEAASLALAPADLGREVDMAVVNSRRYRAQQGALAASEAVKNVDVQELRSRRDQAFQAAAAAVAVADQGEEVDMAVVHSLRYQADRLAHAVLGADMALARAEPRP
jgi:hypothetical protein